jgi:phosphohistidine phosphatase
MEIYILRHGIAEDRALRKADRDRALTPNGRDKLRKVLERAHAAGVSPSLTLTSPFVRAVQTAEMAAEVFGYRRRIVHSSALQPDSTPPAVWEEIRSHSGEPALLLSGHEPLLGELISFLLGSTGSLVDLKKGALARIDVERSTGEPHGLLSWLITPKLA